ncbi:MAG TPA: hypothetical protein VMP08_07685, partial [Anaerolineae bacterium]|nr:hypothetical protein [Anaerolineae bacterium]
ILYLSGRSSSQADYLLINNNTPAAMATMLKSLDISPKLTKAARPVKMSQMLNKASPKFFGNFMTLLCFVRR